MEGTSNGAHACGGPWSCDHSLRQQRETQSWQLHSSSDCQWERASNLSLHAEFLILIGRVQLIAGGTRGCRRQLKAKVPASGFRLYAEKSGGAGRRTFCCGPQPARASYAGEQTGRGSGNFRLVPQFSRIHQSAVLQFKLSFLFCGWHTFLLPVGRGSFN